MRWSLKKPDVELRVMRFLPEGAPAATEPKPIAGLAPMVRALFRDKRTRETRKVELNSRS